MPIIKDGKLVSDDPWVLLDEEQDVPSGGDIIIPLKLAQEKSERLSNHHGRLGLFVPNDVDVEEFAELFDKAELIVLHLPVFTDGRAYSQARILREVLGYKNELRVKGDALPDQAAYLKRCGFDSFDIEGDFNADIWQRTSSHMSKSYQRNYRGQLAHRSL